MQSAGPIALIILDGFGYSKHRDNNAIAQAHTPHLDAWCKQYPSALLQASGTYVGLPAGSVGNSEVGHMTIGAGRVIQQAITRVGESIENKSFYNNTVLKNALARVKASSNRLHIMGLCSDAYVHSDVQQLYAYLKAAQDAGIEQVFLHLFLDGRDVPPRSAATYLSQLEQWITQNRFGTLGSLHGRFYAMDRDGNSERTKKSYDVLMGKTPVTDAAWQQVLSDAYDHGVTDEFLEPVLLRQDACIKPGDGVICFNARPDRVRQLTQQLLDAHALSSFVTPVAYGGSLTTDVLFPDEYVMQTLKDVLAAAGKRMFVIAETEKYAHVTYFFNGMREQPVDGEMRMLIPSLKVTTYAEQPAMSAPAITQAVLNSLADPYDFYLINYANADMVGHSGNCAATIQAIECLDAQLGLLYDAFITQRNGTLYITADHGNAEDMFDESTQQPRTAHTTNLVPFLLITQRASSPVQPLPLRELADIAPYILQRMGLPVPIEMQR